MADIRIDGVSKKYSGSNALRGLDLDIKDGEFFVLLGQTGAGKTTTLRIIAGLEHPDEGAVYIGNENVAGWNVAQRDVALVLQQYSLYPRLTVRGNLEFPLKAKIREMDPAEIKKRVDAAAEILQITSLLDRKVERLSGGEMQRVSIGRAIVREPQVFLMDEPLSALDAKLREALRVELKRLHNDLGATFLYVTHDQVEAMSMGDKIAVLDQGRIVQVGTPKEIYETPCNTFVARSVGTPPMNLLSGALKGSNVILNDGKDKLPIAKTIVKASNDLIFGFRPEDLIIERGAPLEATVFDIEDHGVHKILTMNIGETRLHAMVSAKDKVSLDEKVRFGCAPEKILIFDGKTGANLQI